MENGAIIIIMSCRNYSASITVQIMIISWRIFRTAEENDRNGLKFECCQCPQLRQFGCIIYENNIKLVTISGNFENKNNQFEFFIIAKNKSQKHYSDHKGFNRLDQSDFKRTFLDWAIHRWSPIRCQLNSVHIRSVSKLCDFDQIEQNSWIPHYLKVK